MSPALDSAGMRSPIPGGPRILGALGSLSSMVGTTAISLAGLLIVTFVIARVLPADPVLAIVGDSPSHALYDEVFRQLNLDKPIWQQLLIYVGDMIHGDFGQSRVTNDAVLNDIIRFLPATFELATVSIVIGVIVGVPLGMACALWVNRVFDHIGRVVSLFGHSVPHFWLGLVGLLIFYAQLGIVSGPGRIDIAYQYTVPHVTGLLLVDTLLSDDLAAFRNAVSHIVLPASILGFSAVGYIARMTRSFMIWELQQEYVTVARLKGLSSLAILCRHALPNASGLIVSIIALTYAGLLEGAVLTETVFAWPGLGRYITQSLFAADLAPVVAGTLVIGIIFMICNTLADIFQFLADPRVRQN